MFDVKSLLLIKKEATTEEGKLQQKVVCAYIDGYTDAQAELDRFITKLYRDKDERASNVYRATQELRKSMDAKYDQLCKLLNEIE